MTLKEFRKNILMKTREELAILKGIKARHIKIVENKPLKELTYSNIRIYVTNEVEEEYLLSELLGDKYQVDMKGYFYKRSKRYRNISVLATYNALSKCSNAPKYRYLKNTLESNDIYEKLKINWCYYVVTGEEL